MQSLMHDSRSPEAERRVQSSFRESHFFNSLVLAGAILAMQAWLAANRPSLDLAPQRSTVRWVPIAAPPLTDPRARLIGAWELAAEDGRIGGFSGLVVDRGKLLALTDGGMLAWLPMPPGPGIAELRPLPAVAGNPRTKRGRDAEALVRDPGGGGWWVAFEQVHQLIRYDEGFAAAVARVPLAAEGFRANRGVEALSAAGTIHWYAESSGVSDAATLANGRVLRLLRGVGPMGFRPAIGGLEGGVLRLPLGPIDNAEGLAVEERQGRPTRLWVVTDNDFRRWRPSRLYAVEIVQAAAVAD